MRLLAWSTKHVRKCEPVPPRKLENVVVDYVNGPTCPFKGVIRGQKQVLLLLS
jgi:hypothetical protein